MSNFGFGYGIIPNYLKDLNAMHEAEKTIGAGDKGFEYQRNLELTSNCRHADKWWAVCVTARERADAFLLTTQIAEL